MAMGEGKYNDLCTYVREQAQATGAIVIILQGNKGHGFSCQAPIEKTAGLPEVLRSVANQIEASLMQDKW